MKPIITTKLTNWRNKMEYLKNLLTALDQLGNSITGGNPDVTISARVGGHSLMGYSKYWKVLERVIDFTFEPIDGKNHCLESFYSDDDQDIGLASSLVFTSLSVVVLVSCLFLIPVIRVVSLFYVYKIL